jgi:methyl-accepting chemotaxis protein
MGIFNFMAGKKLQNAELNGILSNEARHPGMSVLASAGTLDALDARVIVLDATHTMVLVNTAARQMLMHAEVEMRKQIPGFNADQLTGSKVDIFFRNPGQQREMFESMLSAQRDRLQFGQRAFDLVMTPVFGDDQLRLGTVLEWREVAEKRKERESEKPSIESMLAAAKPVVPAGPSEAELELRKEVAGHAAALDLIQKAVDAALAGDLAARIDAANQSGPSANMSASINKLLGGFESVIVEVKDVVGSLATGNLTRKITRDYRGSYELLKTDINHTVDKLVEMVSEIREMADKVKQGAAEITCGNTNLSQRTEEQAASLEETSAAMEEITTTVQQNAANAVQANTLARGARETAENGGNVVGRAISAMQAISDSSKKINDIIGVIDEIAFQTNLLALNAAVEAARAGDQGRGFAVVADEVRNLAGRSATAAKEIKDLIKDSGTKVQEGASLVNKSGETLEEIVTAVKKVNDIVAEISTASDEQATGLNEINRAVGEMDEMTQQNAALVEEAASASEQLGQQADTLENLLDFFDTGVRHVRQEVVRQVARPVAKTAARKALERKPERKPTYAAARKPADRRPPPVAPLRTPAKPVRANKSDDSDDNNWSEF